MEKLHFKTSSGIKNILGRDLITDRFVAVFELVKNSYDANATRVDVLFINDGVENRIIIKDDGVGMNKDDLINKWLFIAYSEKKEGHENKSDRAFVGSKGIGRLSCDSLGEYLTIKTKKKNSNIVHNLKVNWNDFEESLEKKIEDVNVTYSFENTSELESNFTELIISGLRHSWNSESDIQKTKRKLERLKNPFVSDNNFNIYCKRNLSEPDGDSIIKNNISEILEGKTISIKATIDDLIVIELYDRGNVIYKISKENDVFPEAKLSIVVHYLNTSAKNQFKRKMGVEAVNYGNIFVYKNGFRVNPYGEKEEDLFGINVRKSQGYNRNLGTREIIGYISIKDTHNLFKESSSRDNGFIHNFYFNQLQDFYK
ncbi:ATP-binding protein, partial [Serratia marcescens]|uniref:ATP-binding protein n=2 Tax=Serratia TaxID=613 RepID=UPI003FA6C2BB